MFVAVNCIRKINFAIYFLLIGKIGGSEKCELEKNITKPLLIDYKFHHMQVYFEVSLLILLLLMYKTSYSAVSKVVKFVPESCLIVILGLFVEFIVTRIGGLKLSNDNLFWSVYFVFLLPSIIMRSSYSLYNKIIHENLPIILYFSIVGTIINFLIFGLSLYALSKFNLLKVTILTSDVLSKSLFTFSAAAMAIDPVGAITVFQDLGVHQRLYYLVFTESVINTGITHQLLNLTKKTFLENVLTYKEILFFVLKFFSAIFGGVVVGSLMGASCSMLTRFTRVCRPIEPLVILLMNYSSFILASTIRCCGISASIFCGLVQTKYALKNIGKKSSVHLTEIISLWGWLSEAVILLLLGSEFVDFFIRIHYSSTIPFMGISLLLCILTRVFTVLVISLTINLSGSRIQKVKFKDQLIIIFGVYQGGLSFTFMKRLSSIFSKNENLYDLYMDAILVIIFFSQFIMGFVLRPLTLFLNIQTEKTEKKSLLKEINMKCIDHLMSALDAICLSSQMSDKLNNWFQTINNVCNKMFIKDLSKSSEENVIQAYKDISLTLHMATLFPNKKSLYFKDLEERVIDAHKKTVAHQFRKSLHKKVSRRSIFSGHINRESPIESHFKRSMFSFSHSNYESHDTSFKQDSFTASLK